MDDGKEVPSMILRMSRVGRVTCTLIAVTGVAALGAVMSLRSTR